MIKDYLFTESLSVVCLGNFNPVIFQPMWLSSKGLIREDEAEKAKVEVMHNEVVRYEVDDWLKLVVTKNRFEFSTTKEPYFLPLRDLVVGIFQILRDTPVTSIGINHLYELSLESEKKYYEFGNKLTPLNIWDKGLKEARLIQLEIFEQKRQDDWDGSRRIRITPSDQKTSFGVILGVNDHYNLGKNLLNKDLLNLIGLHWEKSSSISRELIDSMLNKIGF